MKPHIISYSDLIAGLEASPEAPRTLLASSIRGVHKSLICVTNVITKDVRYDVTISKSEDGEKHVKEDYPKHSTDLREALDFYNEGW